MNHKHADTALVVLAFGVGLTTLVLLPTICKLIRWLVS